MDREELLNHACCPRCGGDLVVTKKAIHAGVRGRSDIIGYRVRHADASAGCSRREWVIYDPDCEDSDGYVNNVPTSPDGRGLSICMTCLGAVQHLEPVGVDDNGLREWRVTDPPTDEAGQPICSLCETRTSPVEPRT